MRGVCGMIGLSIDMDWFARELPQWDFGHSERFEARLSDLLWASRYAFCDLLEESGIHHADVHPFKLLEDLKHKGFTFNPDLRIGVSWSHKDAYSFFGSDPRINRILNLDAHHDGGYIDPPGSLNCGNWLYHLAIKRKIEMQWVVPSWQIMKGVPFCPVQELTYNGIDTAAGQIACIFIAQSPAWVPPHIDHYLAGLLLLALNLADKEIPDFDGGMVERRMPDPVHIEILKQTWKARCSENNDAGVTVTPKAHDGVKV